MHACNIFNVHEFRFGVPFVPVETREP